MLILTRRVHEEIIVGEPGPDQIRIKVMAVSGNQVRIGVGPGDTEFADDFKSIPVHRQEVYDRIQHENVCSEGGEHDWVDARNKVVASGEVCVKCHSVREGQPCLGKECPGCGFCRETRAERSANLCGND